MSRTKQPTSLKEFRESLGLTQRQLAEEFQVTHGAIALWENGKRTIPGPIVRLIEIYESELGARPAQNTLESVDSRWISRNLKMSLAMGRLMASFTGNILKRTVGVETNTLSQAEQLVSTLGDLKGVVMKAGQMVGYMEMGLPKEFRSAFEPLQYSSRPLEPLVIENIVEEELGRPIAGLFSAWDPQPIACGSMGQVHRATLKNGKDVAVKVQYPGVEDSVRSDLNNTRIAELMSFLIFKRQDKQSMLSELSSKLIEECDYNREAMNQERIGFLLEKLVQIPEVKWDLSTRKILTSNFVNGKPFDQFCQDSNQAERNRIGVSIFTSLVTLIFKHRLLYTDPNPGNFLIEDNRVHLIDFGSVKNLSADFVEAWRKYIVAMLNQDRVAAKSLVVEMGFAPNISDYDFEFHHLMFTKLYHPWSTPGPFKFSSEFMTDLWQFIMKKNPNIHKGKIPKDWIFLIRLQWGLFSVLAKLEAEADWNSIILSLVQPTKVEP